MKVSKPYDKPFWGLRYRGEGKSTHAFKTVKMGFFGGVGGVPEFFFPMES